MAKSPKSRRRPDQRVRPDCKPVNPSSRQLTVIWPASKLGPTEIPRFLEDGITTKVAEALKKIGYAHVTLDLQGYRRGSFEMRNWIHGSRITKGKT